MNRLFVGLFLAVLVVIAAPMSAQAGQNDPYFSVSSTSYSGQPSTFSVNIINNLENSRLTARISNSPGLSGTSLSCLPKGAINGLGPWRCTLGGSYRLSPGSFSVTAQASGSGGRSRSVTHSGSVSSRFGISGHTSPTEGEGFSVTGRYDHISGRNDFSVRARVTSGGSVVASQSGTACSASSGSYRCSLRSVVGAGTSYSVTVTEVGTNGYTRSSTTTVPVATTAVPVTAPSAPAFTGPTSFKSDNLPSTITGTSSRPGLRIQVLVDPPANRNWASPTSACTSGGSGSWSCPLPKKLSVGTHRIEARAVDPSDPTKISPVSVRTTTVTKAVVKPKPTPTPTAQVVPEPVIETPPVVQPTKIVDPPFDGLSTPVSELLGLLVVALAVTALSRPGPLSLVVGGNSVAFAEPEDEEAGRELALRRGIGIGDNSPTWRAFGHDATDFYSRTVPGLLARHSPFLARLTTDGIDLRAILGSLWWLFPIGAGALGLTAAAQAGSDGVPPLSLLVIVMALACFDAFAGFVASLLFGIAMLGDVVTDKNSALVVLAVGFLWTSLPLVATAIRPFRRPGRVSLQYGWDRAADLLITAAIAGVIARLIAGTLDLFADAKTGIPADATAVGLVAAGCIGARVLLAQAVDVWWPERLRNTEIQEDLPEPSQLAVISGAVVRVLVFGFLGYAFVGVCWQWWVAVFLFALPELLRIAKDLFFLDWRLTIPLPVGVTEIFLLVASCTLLVAVAVAGATNQDDALRFGLLAAALTPAALTSARIFHYRPDYLQQTGSTWELQVTGALILVATVVLAVVGFGY